MHQPQQPNKTPDFIPAEQPDFIPAEGELSNVEQMAAPDTRNMAQRAFDKFTTVTPEQEKGHSPIINRMQEFGAGAIQGAGQPFVHPLDMLQGMATTIAHPIDTATSMAKGIKEHPAQALGNLVGGAVAGGGVGKLASGALSKLPSAARAAATLNDIEAQAANTPVTMAETGPALQKFGEHVATGGKGAGVMSKLSSRINPAVPKMSMLDRMQAELSGEPIAAAEPPPINFPLARKFYTNVSDVTRKPGALRRMFEDPRDPRLRYAAGPVREALHTDLTNALAPLGLGEDYSGAIKEFARAKALQNAAKRAATVAVPMAAGAVGAKKLHDLTSAVLQ